MTLFACFTGFTGISYTAFSWLTSLLAFRAGVTFGATVLLASTFLLRLLFSLIASWLLSLDFTILFYRFGCS